jgi:DNA-damage-inducible protein D
MNRVQPANGFEAIRHGDKKGEEHWLARELATLLDYVQYRNFLVVVEKAREACRNSGHSEPDHFADISKMVELGSGAYRQVDDIQLSRYACYLIVQNADPSKPIVAFGQTYFALQTRRQELGDAARFGQLPEDERRLAIRHELSEHNKALSAAAKGAGVETPIDYAIFQDHGYKGLYGGLGAKDLHSKRELKKSERILDHMGSTELAANLFRATQAEEKLKRENIKGKVQANKAHYAVGAKVRQTIKELGSTMPEDLPTPTKSIKQIERERVKQVAAVKKAPSQ